MGDSSLSQLAMTTICLVNSRPAPGRPGFHSFFGEAIPAGVGPRSVGNGYAADSVRQRFTSRERDSETGLDYFLARFYSSPQGRFVSADAPFADQFPENPQSWNLHSCTRNNPVRVADKDGRITPWDVLDIISLAMSVKEFWDKPSWGNFGWVVADLAGAVLPVVPVGSIRRAKQLINMFENAASIRNLDTITELRTFDRLSHEGMVIATGERNVRGAVGMAAAGKVADMLTLLPGGNARRFVISEVKAGVPDVADAVVQLTNTANHLMNNVAYSAEVSRLELVVDAGADLGREYRRSEGNLLMKFDSVAQAYTLVRIAGQVVHVVDLRPQPVPSSVPPPPPTPEE